MFSHLFQGLARYFAEWRQRRRAFDELYALDDRSLADLGITRSEIPYVLARAPERREQPAPQAAKQKLNDLRHAA
jgi:uncharacterized protein YjiS (DUF1127 family)